MPATTTSRLKGNPASHRMSNPRTKAYHAKCWENGQKRKAARRAAEIVRAEANRVSGTSPWGDACKARSARRRAA